MMRQLLLAGICLLYTPPSIRDRSSTALILACNLVKSLAFWEKMALEKQRF